MARALHFFQERRAVSKEKLSGPCETSQKISSGNGVSGGRWELSLLMTNAGSRGPQETDNRQFVKLRKFLKLEAKFHKPSEASGETQRLRHAKG